MLVQTMSSDKIEMVSAEVIEAEEELKLSLKGITPRRKRVKIRDKEIELSNIPDDTSYVLIFISRLLYALRLYSLCRDWVRTEYYRPPAKKMLQSNLPPIDDPWNNFDENGKYTSPLVPVDIKPAKTDKNETDPQKIFRGHHQRWKYVAKCWKQRSAGESFIFELNKTVSENDLRYASSYNELQDLAKNLNCSD